MNLRFFPLAAALALAFSSAGVFARTNSGTDTGSALGPRSIAISGTSNRPARANGNGSIALGEEALVNGTSGVAIGSGTPTLADGPIVTTPTLAGASSSGYAAVALGAGSVVSSSGFLAMALGPLANASNSNAVAIGSYSTSSGLSSTAVGDRAQASGNNAFAGGAGARATGTGAVAIGGADAILVAGAPAPANASGTYSVALGAGSSATATDSVSMGRGASTSSANSVSIGVGAIANAGISTEAVSVGAFSEATAGGALALGAQAKASAASSVAIGQFSVANAPMTVSFGSAGQERRLVNVADPINGTDAVNLRTLNSRLAALPPPPPSGPAFDPDAVHYDPPPLAGPAAPTVTLNSPSAPGQEVQIQNLADGVAPTDAVNVRQLQAAVATPALPGVTPADLDARVGEVDQRIDKVEDRAYGGIALSLAMQQPVVFGEGKTTAATLGAGVYQGRGAVAATVSRRVNPEFSNSVLSAGVGFTNGGHLGIRAGVSWSW